MIKKLCAFTACALIFSLAHAEENTLKEGAKEVGHATGNAVHQVGEGAKKAGKEVANVAREVGHATRDGVKAVGHATRDGAKEFHQAVKGESNGAKSSAAAKDSKSTATSSPAHIDK
jgi:hypothetical protein